MSNDESRQKSLKGKLRINATLKILTGMHIGAGSDFAPIGAVDSPFVRDPLTKRPIIPGSSLKGKMRTLLAKQTCASYILNDITNDTELVKRLFGSSSKNEARPARLQFYDLFVKEECAKNFQNIETDTYMGEIKFENTISRTSGIANPRQIERVPAGVEFAFTLVYNIETLDEIEEDLQALAEAITLLQMDYLGGHGSRGYGRVQLTDFSIDVFGEEAEAVIDKDEYAQLFERSRNL